MYSQFNSLIFNRKRRIRKNPDPTFILIDSEPKPRTIYKNRKYKNRTYLKQKFLPAISTVVVFNQCFELFSIFFITIGSNKFFESRIRILSSFLGGQGPKLCEYTIYRPCQRTQRHNDNDFDISQRLMTAQSTTIEHGDRLVISYSTRNH